MTTTVKINCKKEASRSMKLVTAGKSKIQMRKKPREIKKAKIKRKRTRMKEMMRTARKRMKIARKNKKYLLMKREPCKYREMKMEK